MTVFLIPNVRGISKLKLSQSRIALRASHTDRTANGTAIVEELCGCTVASDARRWKCFSGTHKDIFPPFLTCGGRTSNKKKIAVRRSVCSSVHRSACVAFPLHLSLPLLGLRLCTFHTYVALSPPTNMRYMIPRIPTQIYRWTCTRTSR